MVIQEDY